MRVDFHAGARPFLAAAEPLLRTDPLSTNVMAVVARRIVAGEEPNRDDYLWATIAAHRGTIVGAAMHTPPHHVFVSRIPRAAAKSLAQAIVSSGRALPGVNGAVEATRPFAAAWEARTGRVSSVVTAMRLYRLGQLIRPPTGAGAAVVAAAPGDVDLVASWLAAFHEEARPEAPILDWGGLAERRVRTGQVHLWRDGETAVSLAMVSAPAAGVARVGPVYTPGAYRRRGFGAAVTSAATAAALEAGADNVVLYTDLANPTSNSIYQRIGYTPDHDAEERAFV